MKLRHRFVSFLSTSDFCLPTSGSKIFNSLKEHKIVKIIAHNLVQDNLFLDLINFFRFLVRLPSP